VAPALSQPTELAADLICVSFAMNPLVLAEPRVGASKKM
jgi:hypothetical protein